MMEKSHALRDAPPRPAIDLLNFRNHKDDTPDQALKDEDNRRGDADQSHCLP